MNCILKNNMIQVIEYINGSTCPIIDRESYNMQADIAKYDGFGVKLNFILFPSVTCVVNHVFFCRVDYLIDVE